jgi:uncharacterized protein YndB with AHSA1/START domain
MARTERVIDVPPSAVFDVLADPRSYVYWVIGSREIRDADPAWPEPGSRFDHTVNIGPLRIRDHTKVEQVERDRFLQLKARARPFGTARIAIRLGEHGAGTRVTIVEDAADALTAFLFQPLVHFAVRRRNARALERLAELAEGRVRMPGEEPEAPSRRPGEPGAVINPKLHGRRAHDGAAATIARGVLAGVAGALAMSLSTNAEMRLRGRPPSDVPARAIERVMGTRIRGRRRRLGAAPPPWRWRAAETTISVLHHGVYAGTVLAVYRVLAGRGTHAPGS